MAQYHSSKAIVLSALKYGDTSRIVRLYTDQFGLISVLINSVSSKKSAVRPSMLLPLTLLDIVHTHKGDGKLERIKEAKMDLTYTAIPYDPVRNALALFLAELFGKVLREETENREKFDFVRLFVLGTRYLGESAAGLSSEHMGEADLVSRFLSRHSKGAERQLF